MCVSVCSDLFRYAAAQTSARTQRTQTQFIQLKYIHSIFCSNQVLPPFTYTTYTHFKYIFTFTLDAVLGPQVRPCDLRLRPRRRLLISYIYDFILYIIL